MQSVGALFQIWATGRMCPATPKLQRAFGRHKSQAVLVGNPTVCGGFMFGCACHSFSDSVCISNAGFPDVAVSEYYETESHKSLCTSQNTIFLSIFGSLCYTSLSIVYKDAKQFGKTYECLTVKIQASCRNYRRETNKQTKQRDAEKRTAFVFVLCKKLCTFCSSFLHPSLAQEEFTITYLLLPQANVLWLLIHSCACVPEAVDPR